MSRIYDNWEKLVGAVLKREDLRRLALCESFSSSNFSSRPSFDSADPAAPSSLGISVSHNIMAIQFEEIKLATQNFQPDMLLGEGRYGPVYKGWIHEHFLTAVKPGSGIAVAVKMLNKRGIFSWSQPRHPNLVKLIGHSFEEDNRALVLVYEFMPNGSLDNHLFTRGHQLLSWETRVKVAIGAARGLSFFHDSAIMVTHEGVKSSSILLDDEFNAQFSDLDLTTAAPSLIHTISTPVRKDYAAPEYIAPDRLTMKSDVYSFGIILLELLSGLRVCDKNRPIKEQNLVVWAKPYLMNKRKLVQIVDSRLEGQYPHDGAYKICKLAYQCLSSDPKLRPRMTEVVDALEQLSSSLSPASHYRQDPAELSSGEGSGSMNWNHNLKAANDLEPQSPQFDVSTFTFHELEKAANDFSADRLLGEGGRGRVYKGQPERTNQIVAIKQLNRNGVQGNREFLTEVLMLSKLHHPNIVNLIGYCADGDHRLLVYEYMPLGSLKDNLHDLPPDRECLDWNTRMKIAAGVAKSLEFLHDNANPPVIYRDLKCSHILLDEDYHPKLTGFGLAKLGPVGGKTHVSTRVMGTYGYCAPEYAVTGQLTLKCDVYSFGVVLLEIITGRKAIDNSRAAGEHNLVAWARPLFKDRKKLVQMVDPMLQGQYPIRGLYQALAVAAMCLQEQAATRPLMADVVASLTYLASQIYNPGTQPVLLRPTSGASTSRMP